MREIVLKPEPLLHQLKHLPTLQLGVLLGDSLLDLGQKALTADTAHTRLAMVLTALPGSANQLFGVGSLGPASLRASLARDHRANTAHRVLFDEFKLQGVDKHAGDRVEEVAACLDRTPLRVHAVSPPLPKDSGGELVEPVVTQAALTQTVEFKLCTRPTA